MPGLDFGVYTGELDAGTEVSSTYEGRHVTVLETELIHPFHADGLVDKGDQVLLCNAAVKASYGRAVGVALTSATAATDYIAIDTEGIFNLTVFSYTDGAAGSAIVAGDPLFIHDESLAALGALGLGDGMLSKIRNTTTQVPFGYALGRMGATSTGQVAVKVHWDPHHDLIEGMHRTLATTEFGWSFYGHLEDGVSEGVSGYVNGILDGAIGQTYNFGSWLNLLTGVRASAWLAPYEGGIYADAGATTTNVAYAGYHHFVGDASADPSNMFCAWHLNVQNVMSPVTAVIHAASTQAVGWQAQGVSETSPSLGVIPLAYIVGSVAVPGFVRLYADNL